MSHESADFVVRRLFTAGLALGSCVRLLDPSRAKRITAVISELDDVGRAVRRSTLLEGRDVGRLGGDPHRLALIAGMNRVVSEITGRLDALGRADAAEEVPSPHLLDAVQSLERALAYLRDGTSDPDDEVDLRRRRQQGGKVNGHGTPPVRAAVHPHG